MLKNTKILVTGATGFVGANIVHYFLRKGARIVIFSRKTSDKRRLKNVQNDISDYCVDLLDEQRLKQVIQKIKPEIIFHAVTYGGYPFQNNFDKILETNFIGTVNLLNACKKIEFGLFVNIGSSSEYGIKTKPMKESDSLEPITDYGVSKASAALYCQAVAKRENRPVVTLRLFSPYGYCEDSNRLIPSVIISCLQGRNPKVSSSGSFRDFIFIEDVMDAYNKTLQNKKDVSGEVFNIGYGKQHSVSEVVNTIIKLTGAKVEPKWGWIFNPRIEPKVWQADIAKASRILDWKPKHSLVQGLERTINWFKENRELYR